MSRLKSVFVCLLFVCLCQAGAAYSVAGTTIPLIVDKGSSLQVLLTEKLHFKEHERVVGTIIEPVYAFDREVIPSGTRVEGTITGFHKLPKSKRISAMLGGNFTPQREPLITFHTLVLSGGERIAIETSVVSGTEKVTLKKRLWGLSPYRPQYVAAGTHLSAVLLQPLDFGAADFDNGELDSIGSDLPDDILVSARLITPLDSHVTHAEAPVEALLTRPVFSQEHHLLFPVGSRLRGDVTQVSSARGLHRNGQLSFALTTIEPPDAFSAAPPRQVQGKYIERIVESKKRFIAPAWAFIKAERSLSSTADPFDKALLGAYRGKFLRQMAGSGDSGFGLPGSISGAMIPPVGIGLSFYGAVRSIYSNFLARGRDIDLPENTVMQIRLKKR